MTNNPYLDEVVLNLPRLLGLFDLDRTSSSYGFGDRYYWAWGLIDFGNGSFQGAAHGLARLWSSNLWPYSTPKSIFLDRIDAIFQASSRLVRNNGSLEEAFPNEGSYCVTALVAFDLLCAYDLLANDIPVKLKNKWQSCISPLIRYLISADETHALISNHLATALAALSRWYLLTGDVKAEKKSYHILQRILIHQSHEGWFSEYGGADPGYQSLCTYYLADVYLNHPDMGLLEPLRRSIQFLQYFVHPDGSFGGIYGSRNTRFYYPAGIIALSNDIPEAFVVSKFMESSIRMKRTVTLSAMDEPNFIPMFNAYAWAATQFHEQNVDKIANLPPSRSSSDFQICFEDAGLFVDRGIDYYTIIGFHKGGVVYHFPDDNEPVIDVGVVVKDPSGRLGSTQGYSRHNMLLRLNGEIHIKANITAMPKQLPSPIQFLLIRIFSLSIFRFSLVREWLKRRLVKLLITRNHVWPASNLRIIRLGSDINIMDNLSSKPGYKELKINGVFVAIHMASQGYWQIQDEF